MRVSLRIVVLCLLALLISFSDLGISPVLAQGAEICTNGVDDDGDGLIDCQDSDCGGQYIDSGQTIGNSESFDVSLGDVDGDGDLDAWVANSDGPNRVWLNEGGAQGGTPGVFIDSGQTIGNSQSLDVSLGDVDGDGDLDAFVVNDFLQANRVWLNDGGDQGGTPGIYIDSGQTLGISAGTDVSLGDLDGDGDLDAWVANAFVKSNEVWLNAGGAQGGTPGIYIDSGQTIGSSASFDVSLGDFDGDGDLDAWVANGANQPNEVWLNAGGVQGGASGTYLDSGQILGNSTTTDVSLGDVDGDGDLDAWVTNIDGPNRVWLNEGGVQGGTLGVFVDSGQTIASSNSYGVSLGDVDGDGDLDAWVANFELGVGQPNRVWLNPCSVVLFTRGDVSVDQMLNLADAVTILGYLFSGGLIGCLNSADSNDDSAVDLGDAIHVLNYLFTGGAAPPFPFPGCGIDPTPDSLTCESNTGCLLL